MMGFNKAKPGDVCKTLGKGCGAPALLALDNRHLRYRWCERCWKKEPWRDKDGIDRTLHIWNQVMAK